MKKLNYLLIMPRYVSEIGEGYFFSMGIAYISAALKEAGFNVFTMNLNHIRGEVNDLIVNEIKKSNIDVVMTGGLSTQYSIIKNIIDCVHYNMPDVKIIIGGGIITCDPETAMTALENADIGVIGEGELICIELCNAMEKYGCDDFPAASIAGVIYKDNNFWIQTGLSEEISDLDTLPFPDYDGFDFKHYVSLPSPHVLLTNNSHLVYIVGSRSCPYQCTFCFNTSGKKYRQRSIDNILQETEMLVKKYDAKTIRFCDELFARNIERIKIIEETAKKHNFKWIASLRVDDINEEIISVIKNGNNDSITLGLESASNKILKSMKKNITLEQIDRALKLLYNAGITATGNFIFGDIEETVETATETLEYWKKNKEYNISLTFITPYPGSYIYKYALENHVIKDAVQYIKDGCPHVNVSKLSDDELSWLSEQILFQKSSVAPSAENCKMMSFNTTEGLSLKGSCIKCGTINTWKNVLLFSESYYSKCYKCGQKHIQKIPKELEKSLIKNITEIGDKSKKIGLWGVTSFTIDIFKNNDIFMNDKFIFIDNAFIKQKVKIKNKSIYPPSIISDKKIETVFFFYPNFFANKLNEIKQKYPTVTNFVSVYELLGSH